VSQPSPGADDARIDLLAAYDAALPHVYGYLVSRCGDAALAEDLTSDTFLAAVAAVGRDEAPPISTAWLVGIARHKLADHWRRRAREQRSFRVIASEPTPDDDHWEESLDALRARQTLGRLDPYQRAALTLRYVDDLPVAEVASILDRTVHGAEALLVRARSTFRGLYAEEETGG
jgi:RNA polymerase sigma-70 factor, ECF subfamily